jgi:phosphoribosylformylglycinamidine cyclo-ligase
MLPEIVGEVLGGLALACRQNGCALLGGETAEMPGMYAEGDYDLAGTIVGAVDRPMLLDGTKVQEGDLLIGLPSSGLHTNGYTLARKIFFEGLGMTPQTAVPELSGQTVAEALLAVHRSYLSCVLPLAENLLLSAMAHITGGGFPDNIPRVLPAGLDAVVHPDAWSWPPLFKFLRDKGHVSQSEMLRVFNCGIGMVLIVPPARGLEVKSRLDASGEDWKQIGRVQKGARTVRFA